MGASLIIAAGGSGSRFKKTLQSGSKFEKFPSKLFYPLAGKPLLEHTLGAFQKCSAIQETIVAAPQGLEKIIQEIAKKNKWRSVKVVRGGETRAESVWNALKKTSPKSKTVFVHDGARPFIGEENLERLLAASKKYDAVLLAKKVVPTIKEINLEGSVKRTIDRNVLVEAETPQVLNRALLTRAYEELPEAFQATDESSLAEAMGTKVHVVTHEGWNPKITTYKDFELAEAYLNQNRRVRTGFGRDTHRLVPKRKFWLGGIVIPFDKGPQGHSDGDALIHAMIDGILGATGRGDIGDWFSDQDPKFKNIASSKMLQKVLEETRAAGYEIQHADTVIILEKPKLGAYKQQMKRHLAKLLGLAEDAVSIKAKTAEGLGPEGEGLAVTCEALVSIAGPVTH